MWTWAQNAQSDKIPNIHPSEHFGCFMTRSAGGSLAEAGEDAPGSLLLPVYPTGGLSPAVALSYDHVLLSCSLYTLISS